jgi:hypothetical protein
MWLWDAPGPTHSACGVSSDRVNAQLAARACLVSGQASAALVQEAELVTSAGALTPSHRRFGGCWGASRTRDGAIRWRPLAALAAS